MDEQDHYPRECDDRYMVEPLHLTFSEYGSPASGAILTWDTAKKELRLGDRLDTTEGRVLSSPTRAQWKAFWLLLDKAKVWEWQSEYVDEIGICDGGGWSLEISYAGRRIKSGGVNAYPDTRDTNYLPGSPFDILCTAILMRTHSEFPGIGDNN